MPDLNHSIDEHRALVARPGPMEDANMTEQDWMNTIQTQCTDARIVQGGTNCRNKEGNGFCYFEYCPKVK